MENFRDDQNQQEEIVQRLINIKNNQTDSENMIEVKHKYIDFQNIEFG